MRKLLLLIALPLLVAGCEKDPLLGGGPENKPGFERNETDLGAVHKPFSATFTTLPGGDTLKLDDDFSISAGGSITGNATHVGLINAELSNWKVTNVGFSDTLVNLGNDEDPVYLPEYITEFIEGEIHSPAGDHYNYKGEAIIHVPTLVLSGEMRFEGGTGRFEGVSGAISLSGTANFAEGSATFKGNGTIIYPN